MANLKVAKPTKQDFDICYRFNSVMEQLTDNRMYRCADESDWQDWDENDEDVKVLTEIRDEYCKYTDKEKKELDNDDHQQILWRYVKWFFNNHPSSLGRVVMCADIAMNNAFDNSENVDTIEWNKRCSEALDSYSYEEHLKDMPVTKEVLELNGFEQRNHDYLTNDYTHIRIASDDTAEVFDYSVEGEEITMCLLHSILELDQFMRLRERGDWQLKLPERLGKE